jgi:hypothetical protein
MKKASYKFILLIIALASSACGPGVFSPTSSHNTLVPTRLPTTIMPITQLSSTPTLTETSSSPPIKPLTRTETPLPLLTATLTPPATLIPINAKATINASMQELVDCSAPCFWGITPGQTTLGEALNIFTQLGLSILTNTEDNKTYYGVRYEFTNGSSLGVSPIVNNDLITSLVIDITPEERNVGTPKGWITYSPETLIKRYGLPDRVDFYVGYPRDLDPTPTAFYYMDLYFDDKELIVEYSFPKITPPISELRVCPLTDQSDLVRIWLGKYPYYPPLGGVPLEEATSMTVEEFSALMMADPAKACFNLKSELFP